MQISECVQNIMIHIYQVTSSFYCEVGLVFPFFTVGVAGADDKVITTYVRRRLENIESWTKFQHVARILELLESMWASGRTDWEALLRKLDWQISIT